MISETVGIVKKCPRCGEFVESFQTRCSSCGFEISGQKVSDSLQDFVNKISEWDDESYHHDDYNQDEEGLTVHSKKISIKERFLRDLDGTYEFVQIYKYLTKLTGHSILAILVLADLLFIFYGIGLISTGYALAGILLIVIPTVIVVSVFILVALFGKPKLSSVDKRKERLIVDFPVPNSKEDILEFTAFSVSHIQHYSREKKFFTAEEKKQKYWNIVWENKCKQLYIKSKLAMREDPETLRIIKELLTDAGIKLDKKR